VIGSLVHVTTELFLLQFSETVEHLISQISGYLIK
jgi:hypothetical protein